MTLKINVYGEYAKKIKPGDIFMPEFGLGRNVNVVSLVRKDSIAELLDKYDNSSISLDQIIKYLREISMAERK